MSALLLSRIHVLCELVLFINAFFHLSSTSKLFIVHSGMKTKIKLKLIREIAMDIFVQFNFQLQLKM